jgi:hypothetical protein
MSKRLSTQKRKEIIDQWNDGKVKDVNNLGYYVIKTKNGKGNVRQLRPKTERGKPLEKQEEEKPKKEKKTKENIL